MFLKCVITVISLGRPDQREKKNRGDLQPISGMKRNITVDVSDGEPIREYYEWLYINSFENMQDMDAFVENYKFPTMKKIENLFMWLFS